MKQTVKNAKELNALLQKELDKAMNIVATEALADLYEETASFYTGTEPKQYERTGALGDTPRVTPVTSTTNSSHFDAYLDTDHQYTTGKTPNMKDVLKLANYGETKSSVGYLRPTRGKRGFWEAAEEKIKHTYDKVLSKFFEKL